VKKRPLLLLTSAVLFAGWMGWLGYLAATKREPVVLSRPQLLTCEFAVIAELADHKGPVTVEEVFVLRGNPAAHENIPDLKGKQIEVVNLERCTGYAGPGPYILALASNLNGEAYQVVPTPPSPGFFPNRDNVLRIYPATPDTRWQLGAILEPR
jgi:hypothetical protein